MRHPARRRSNWCRRRAGRRLSNPQNNNNNDDETAGDVALRILEEAAEAGARAAAREVFDEEEEAEAEAELAEEEERLAETPAIDPVLIGIGVVGAVGIGYLIWSAGRERA